MLVICYGKRTTGEVAASQELAADFNSKTPSLLYASPPIPRSRRSRGVIPGLTEICSINRLKMTMLAGNAAATLGTHDTCICVANVRNMGLHTSLIKEVLIALEQSYYWVHRHTSWVANKLSDTTLSTNPSYNMRKSTRIRPSSRRIRGQFHHCEHSQSLHALGFLEHHSNLPNAII
ncbi:uncharacterized protein BO96DRAFT_430848 [Aspergillus niger CBS 101883]|uniref:Uncharacterized protein n=2 Tax=Aspergillus niger TaxID=5061 RepID=A2RBK4_ASPNC|nr:uncharacterized protein BO96DRAFT_430848 [Aspergillus niger CBS 101883]XP_059605063.1 hypothetical protein An19g00190 [Aspergillus niger]PYH59744.1 hypothetical protein BO96DRAFT_430848 [Aspergillus niger CBS 101883]CAK47342.1 hypothetical protein An19g00190 [Aspergillus niger]